MNCPYCGKRTSDIPDHLKKSKSCLENHKGSLAVEFMNSFYYAKEQEKIILKQQNEKEKEI